MLCQKKQTYLKKAKNEMLDVYDYETNKQQIKPLPKSGAMFTANRFDPRHKKYMNNFKLTLIKTKGDSLPKEIKENDTISLTVFVTTLEKLMSKDEYLSKRYSMAELEYKVEKINYKEQCFYNAEENNFELEIIKEDKSKPAINITKASKKINVQWNELPINRELNR